MFDNFNIYNNKSYDKCNNIIFKSCIRQHCSSTLDLQKIDLLENALQFRTKLEFKENLRRQFMNRITSCTYSESRSAFQEITIMYKIGQATSNTNIQCERRLPGSSRNPDVYVSIDGGRGIYLEITSVSTSETDRKLQRIFDTAAKHFYSKISQHHRVSVRVDTTKLPLNYKTEIDEEKSKKMIHDQIDQVGLDQIDDMQRWSSTPSDQLFQIISLTQTCAKSSVYIIEDEIHYSPPQEGSAAYLQKHASLNQIERTIKTKVKQQQYKNGSPAILVIYWKPKIMEYENSENDYCYIKGRIECYLQPYPEVSGVFLFHSDDHTNGKFIHNPVADEAVRISEAEVNQLFFATCKKFGTKTG